MSRTIFLANAEFDGQFSRTLQAATVGMADLGEAYVTAREIGARYDTHKWFRAWRDRAIATESLAQEARRDGHLSTACDAYLRATEYYRQSYFYLRTRLDDARLSMAYDAHVAMFANAAELLGHTAHPARAELAEIPYRDARGDTTLHGWWLTPADPARRRGPTIVMPAGYDSTAESGWVYSVGAVARGYTVLSVEGPGQGKSLYRERRYFRPDYEVVASQILDWVLARDDADAVALMGRSFGGYLAPRAVAHDDRWSALVCDPAQPDMGAKLPSGPAGLIAAPAMTALSKVSPEKADFFASRMSAHGIDSVAKYFTELRKYTMLADASSITCPTLIVECPDDPVGGGGQALRAAIGGADVDYHEFVAGSGVDGHIGGLGQRPWEETVYDWLDVVLDGERERS